MVFLLVLILDMTSRDVPVPAPIPDQEWIVFAPILCNNDAAHPVVAHT